MNIDAKLEKLERLAMQVEAIASAQHQYESFSPNKLIALGCIEIAIEHTRAIVILTRKFHYSSAFALLRLLIEALVRHFWFLNCSTDSDIEKLKSDTLDLKVKKMQSDLDLTHPKIAEFISTLWQNPAMLHSLTHTGRDAIFRRLDLAKGSIGGKFDQNSSCHLCAISEAILLRICTAYSEMFDNQPFNMSIKMVIEQFDCLDR